ncbi:phosphotransferase family protein [Streptomyces sp. NPDC058867]|uniref:phosphotransferase family protein n=1 Tax=unclassified Streptomyces TaxID=2593676 RepID=UPI0036D1FDB7
MTPNPLVPDLARAAAAAAHAQDPDCPCAETRTLADRADGTVVRHGAAVAKAHAPDADSAALAVRLETAARLPEVLLPPLPGSPTSLGNRPVTCWPYGTPVDPQDPDSAPWEAAGTLLARLHRRPPLPGTPTMRGPEKAARAVDRLRSALAGHPCRAAGPVLRAWRTLPAWARAETPAPGGAPALCHGDFHLGQLVRHPAPHGPWRLIDVDDLGTGVAAWDLARPAAWFACGLLSPEEWDRFLAAYRAAGGPAVGAHGDPWATLDVPARALTVQTAATAVAKAVRADRTLDEVEMSLIDACVRMASVPAELTRETAK